MSGGFVVPQKTHAELGASNASRWIACPGSIRLSRTVPVPPTSDYAKEGNAAHALAELCLRNGLDTSKYIGATLEGMEVTDDMADFVRVFVDHCRELQQRAGKYHWTEQKFNLGAFNPPGPMFGTADFMALVDGILYVPDLKYGQGVVVEAKGNPQLRYYALGALLALPRGLEVREVVMTIIQPRVQHPDGVIRSETIAVEELLGFANELLAAARATQAPDAPLVPGKHCKWCPAAGVCPAQRDHVQELAQIEFANAPLEMPRAPETLSDAELVSVLSLVPMLENWAASVRAHAQAKLERGESLPGMKLVEGRANRKWSNEEEAEQFFLADGYEKDEITTTKLKSPAQMEKVVGKKNLPTDLVFKPQGKMHLVPESDPRPAVLITPGEEFLALPAEIRDES